MKRVSTGGRRRRAASGPGSAGGRAIATICLALAVAAVVVVPELQPGPLLHAQIEDLEQLDDLGRPQEDQAKGFPEQDEPLADVQIEGNLTIPPESISQHIKTRAGRPAEPNMVRQDINSLWRTRWFANVEARYRRTEKGLVLIFKVLERPVVGKVEYRGNDKIKTKHLDKLTGLKPGSPYDISANRESARRIEAYYHEKGFTFATVELESGNEKDDRDVVFLINEGPKVRVTSLKFEGNEFWSDALLKQKLQTKKAIFWKLGGLYDPATIPNDLAALKQYYQSVGFFDAKVEHEVGFSKNRDRVQIKYLIEEGPRYKLRNLSIEGNQVFSDEDLRKEMTLAPGEFFNALKLGKDLGKVKNKYGELGRLYAQVEAVPRFLETPGEADLVYRIDEDRVYRIRKINVHIEGDFPHTKKTVVLNPSFIHPGDLADPREIERTKRKTEGLGYFERGPDNGVRINIARVDDTDEKQLADVRGQSSDSRGRGQNRAGRVTTTAKSPAPRDSQTTTATVDDDVWLPFVPPGDLEPTFYMASPPPAASRAPTIRAQSFDGPFREPGNPIFENSPQGDPFSGGIITPPPPGEVDIDIFATKARTGRLMFGVGVNSDAGVVGSFVLSEENFDLFRPPTSFADIVNGTAWRGAGQRFRLEAIPGSVVSRYSVNWTDPYFLDTDYSLGVSGFYFNRFYPAWDEQRAGGRVQFGRQLTQEISASIAIRLEEVEITNPDVPTPPILAESVGSNFLSTVRGSIAHDTRDSPFLASEGHFVQLSYEQAFGDFDYPRLEAEARQYYTVYARPDGGGRHILMVGGQMGWTGSDTPIFERYFAGGYQTFRGFAFRGVGPEVFDVRVGGEWMAIGTVEYMLPLMASEMIQGVAFSDFGTVENDVGFEDFRATAGVGLRVAVPAMGPVPLAFDFAFPIAKQDEDDTRVFSFYVGINR